MDSKIFFSQHRAVALGLLTGLLNGLIALGGGILITPFLIFVGVSPKVAVGTSLVAVTILSGIGFTVHSHWFVRFARVALLALLSAQKYSRASPPNGC